MAILPVMISMFVQAAAPIPAAVNVPEPDAARMSMAEVKAFNAKVPPNHPYRIRCQSIAITGSLSKRGRVCRTTAEWQRLREDGEAHARAIVEHSATRQGGQ